MYQLKLFLTVITLSLLYSCGSRKQMVYFQTETDSLSVKSYTPTFKSDDLLSIKILADDPESVIPFNMPVANQNSTMNSGYSQGNPERDGYLVDENGMINLPILGQIHVGGMKRSEVVTLLQGKLSAYLSHPIVNIQIMNFKITILGDVRNPGTFKIPNERITILEALGLSGDAELTGERNNLLIVRERDGKKIQYRMDLTNSESVFNSPAYYLEQNDVVYVEPNFNKRSSSSFWRSSASIFISISAVIISTINTFK